ncbi:hypothetical protein [Streptomyces flavidovirens]|uniref:Secreted protein n=1 Tax=Streptomyces flavidovirens TaxID=67298 RepID=A0ABW6RQ00_9ACTN
MHHLVRRAAVALLLSASAVAGATGTALADDADGHHESKPKIDCSKNRQGTAALLSPHIGNPGTDNSAAECAAFDNAKHAAYNNQQGILNDAL